MFLTTSFFNLNVKYLLQYLSNTYMELSFNTYDNVHDELLFSLIILINWCYAQFQVVHTSILFINIRTIFFFLLLFNTSQLLSVFFNGSSTPYQVTMIL